MKICENGFHFCETLQQVDEFYSCNNENNVFCEVEATGKIIKEKEKCVTDKIKIVKILEKQEFDILVGKINGNLGFFNTGNLNTGDKNTGDWNTGNLNTGDWNTGNWNKCNRSTGLFNTKEPTLTIFNIDSGLTYDECKKTKWFDVVIYSKFNLTEWIEYTEEEKKESIILQCIGGYLKSYTYQEACANWWDNLSNKEKEIVQTIPNFNKDIFEEITGIKI